MTAAVDDTSVTFNRLIETCEEAEASFREAAELSDDAATRRLLTLYSQQRTRFAEELRKHLPGPLASSGRNFGSPFASATQESNDILTRCLTMETRALDRYRDALRERIPAKAHFLVAAQYALMQKVHERMLSLLPANQASSARPAILSHRATL
jgi:hypothetical protein